MRFLNDACEAQREKRKEPSPTFRGSQPLNSFLTSQDAFQECAFTVRQLSAKGMACIISAHR